MNHTVRKAREKDCREIGRLIAHCFEKDISFITKDQNRAVAILESSLDIRRFYVAEQNGGLIGVAAYADSTGRAFKFSKEVCIRQLGPFRGRIFFKAFRANLMRPLPYPAATGYIDLVGVLASARGKGVAKEMIKVIIENHPQYEDFMLDTASDNLPAIKSYTDFGFAEVKRERIPFTRRRKVVMRYQHS